MDGFSTVRRTLTGSAIALPLALLANRYILGNKSTASKVWAGVLGATLGGAGGYYYDHRQKQEKLEQLTLAREALENPDKLFADPDKYRGALIASGISAEKLEAALAEAAAVRAHGEQLQDLYKKDPEKFVRTFSADIPLDYMGPKGKANSAKLAKWLLPRPQEGVYGIRNMDPAQFEQAMIQSGIADRKQFIALCRYHQALEDGYRLFRGKKFNDAFKSPVDLDYIALQSLPEDLRSQVTVSHRLVSVQRAVLTRGGSYALDHDYLLHPAENKRHAEALMGSQMLADVAAAGGTAYTGNLGRFAFGWGRALLDKGWRGMKPKAWGEYYDRNSKADDFTWNVAVAARGYDLNTTPQYEYMLPEANRRESWLRLSAMVPEAVDAVRDAKDIWSAVDAGNALDIGVNVADNTISRSLNTWFGTFSPHSYTMGGPTMLSLFNDAHKVNVPKAVQYTDAKGKPAMVFDQILLSFFSGHSPVTGIRAKAKETERWYSGEQDTAPKANASTYFGK